jgi:sodium/potassium-transporting ATPase subunit alpha
VNTTKIHQVAVAEALASVQAGIDGLSSLEAQRRLEEHGANVMPTARQERLWLRLLKEYLHFFSLILWAAAGLAFFAEWHAPGQGMDRVGIAIVAVILISGTFSFWQERRVERALAALGALLPHQVHALRDRAVVLLPREQLVPGDIVLVEPGQSIPADCRLVEAHEVRVNTATITGESRPKRRDALPSSDDRWLASTNILLAGTSLVAGRGRAVVFATGPHTELGRIAALTQTAGDSVSPLRLELAHLSRRIAVFAVGVGVLFLAAGHALGIPFWRALIFSIGIIVALVPEGLLPTLTLALVLASQRMAQRNVLIRHLPSVETLGSATVICTDKTGTLTENRMRVRTLLLGLDRQPVSALERDGGPVEQHRELFVAAAVCHSLEASAAQGVATLLGDPMELALVDMATRLLPAHPGGRRVGECPFDAERMRQSVVIDKEPGRTMYCKGAPETVLPLCVQIAGPAGRLPLDAVARDRILHVQEQMAGEGLRVIALAFRPMPEGSDDASAERDLVFCGLAGLEDPPRPEVPEALRKCRTAGIRVIMVTGDHPRTAVAIAREIGLVNSADPLMLSGEQLLRLSATQLQLALDAPEVIFARVAADQKLRIVEALRNKQHIVAVTGDGVNDAPALKAAHIGIAMGRSGTDVAKEAADMILLDDNFSSIVDAVEEGRATFQNIRKFLTYVLVHNVAELVPYLAFVLLPVPLALTPIQALAIDMGTDSLTALGLGTERPDPQAMQRPPRARGERLLNTQLALRSGLFLGPIEAVAALTAFFFVLHGGAWAYGDALAANDPQYLTATTAAFSAIIAMQTVNVFLCRSSVRSLVATGLGGNRLIAWGVGLELALLLLVVYTPWGNAMFGTAALPPSVWLCILPFAVAMVVAEEARKWLVRSRLHAEDGRWRPPL